MTDGRPVVLFVCVHNAGRSQMAAAFTERLSNGEVRVVSGGSQPAEKVHEVVADVMAEVGIDVAGVTPRPFTEADVEEADVVVTMGCGDACPVFPGKRYLDWKVEDPAGKDIAAVRAIRDDVAARVRQLLKELGALR